MGLKIRRVTQTKYKLLFASLAIMALAVQPMYGFVASRVANAKTTDGPAEIAEFTATSKCVAGNVAVDVTGLSKAGSAQASAKYSTTIGSELTGEWTNIKTGVTATGMLQSEKAATNGGIVIFMVPLGVNTGDFFKYTADYDAIDCGPVFGKTTPVNNTTVVQSNERFEVSAEATSSLSTIKSISWEMTGAKNIKSSEASPKFKKVSDGKWAASYETVNIPTGDYTMTFTATDAAGKKSAKTIENISLVLDTDSPVISEVKLNGNTPKMMPTDNGVSYEGEAVDAVSKKFTVTAKITDPNTVNVYNSKLMRLNSSGYTYDRVQNPVVTRDGDTWSFTIDTKSATAPVTEGMYQLFFNAKDSLGNISKQRINVLVDNTAPKVSIENPSDKAVVSGEISLKGVVENETNDSIKNTYFFIADSSGEKVKASPINTSGNAVHEMVWDTSGVANGEYTIYFEARDKANNKDGSRTNLGDSVAMVKVMVDNTQVEPSDGSGEPEDGTAGPDGNIETGGGDDLKTASPIDLDLDPTRNPTDPDNRPSSPNSIFNRNLALNLDDDDATDQATTGTLGDNTVNATPNSSVKGASDEKANTGLAWYWWALIVAALLAAIWWIAAAARKKQDA